MVGISDCEIGNHVFSIFSRGCNHYKSIHFAGAKIHFFFQIQFFLAKYSNFHLNRTSFPFKSINESSPHQQSTPSVQRKDYFQNSRVQPPAGNITMSRKNIAIINTPIVIATLKNLYKQPGLPSFFRLSNSIVMTLIPFFESIQKALKTIRHFRESLKGFSYEQTTKRKADGSASSRSPVR